MMKIPEVFGVSVDYLLNEQAEEAAAYKAKDLASEKKFYVFNFNPIKIAR